MLFGVNACVGFVLTMRSLRWNCNLRAVNTHPMHAITQNSPCADPPEDGQVMTLNKIN
jgi:hypothetical protein